MSRRRALVIRGLPVLIVAASFIVVATELRGRVPSAGALQDLSTLLTVAAFVVFGVTGGLILSRQARNTVGWLHIVEGCLVFVWPVARYFETLPGPPAQPSTAFAFGLWFANWSWLWLIFPLLMIPLHFPTGVPPSPRWNWLRVLAAGLVAFFLLVTALAPEISGLGEPTPWRIPNPIGAINLEFLLPIWIALLLLVAVASVASLFVRYRRASATERSQIKWLLYAGALFLVVYALGFAFDGITGTAGFNVALFGSILALPTAIAIAILRYRLYDIDIVIRRTLVYAAVTALLGLVFYGTILLFQRLFTSLTGQQSPVAIVASTLVIAALFSPLRRRVQDFVDRRFYRRKYDAQRVLTEFAAVARNETDIEQLAMVLESAVQETMQPSAINIWVARS